MASVLELDDNLNQDYKVFEAAPQVGHTYAKAFSLADRIHQDSRAFPAKAAVRISLLLVGVYAYCRCD